MFRRSRSPRRTRFSCRALSFSRMVMVSCTMSSFFQQGKTASSAERLSRICRSSTPRARCIRQPTKFPASSRSSSWGQHTPSHSMGSATMRASLSRRPTVSLLLW